VIGNAIGQHLRGAIAVARQGRRRIQPALAITDLGRLT